MWLPVGGHPQSPINPEHISGKSEMLEQQSPLISPFRPWSGTSPRRHSRRRCPRLRSSRPRRLVHGLLRPRGPSHRRRQSHHRGPQVRSFPRHHRVRPRRSFRPGPPRAPAPPSPVLLPSPSRFRWSSHPRRCPPVPSRCRTPPSRQGRHHGEGHQGLAAPSAVLVDGARICHRVGSVSNVSSPRFVHNISRF